MFRYRRVISSELFWTNYSSRLLCVHRSLWVCVCTPRAAVCAHCLPFDNRSTDSIQCSGTAHSVFSSTSVQGLYNLRYIILNNMFLLQSVLTEHMVLTALTTVVVNVWTIPRVKNIMDNAKMAVIWDILICYVMNVSNTQYM